MEKLNVTEGPKWKRVLRDAKVLSRKLDLDLHWRLVEIGGMIRSPEFDDSDALLLDSAEKQAAELARALLERMENERL